MAPPGDLNRAEPSSFKDRLLDIELLPALICVIGMALWVVVLAFGLG
ncbi:hypothetical protein [Defluviimonas sp. SAOS-178_SWC]